MTICLVFGCAPDGKQEIDHTFSYKSKQVRNISNLLEFRSTPPEWSISRIRTEKTGWKRNERQSFAKSFNDRAFWFKLRLNNQKSDLTQYLTLDNTRLDSVDFFLETEDGFQKTALGDHQPTPPGLSTALPTFQIQVPAGKSRLLYFRIHSSSTISFPAHLYSSEGYGQMLTWREYIHWVLLTLLLFYLVFQVRFNPGITGYVELYLGSLMAFILFYFFCIYGDANRLLWPNSPFLKDRSIFVLSLIGQILPALFIRPYLKLPEIAPRLNRTINVYNLFLTGLLPVLIFWDSAFWRITLTSVTATGNFILIVLGMIFAFRRGYYWVLFLTVSWLSFGVTMALHILAHFGPVPYNFFTENSILIIFPLDGLILAISLVYRHRRLKMDRDRLQIRIEAMQTGNELAEPEPQKAEELPLTGKQRSLRIQNLDSSKILANLADYFREERPYLDENLNMTRAAEVVGIRLPSGLQPGLSRRKGYEPG